MVLTTKPPTPARKTPDQMSLFEKREQLIRLRLESLDRGRKLLSPQERWPTVKGVRAYRDRQVKTAAQALSTPIVSPTPTAITAVALPSQPTSGAQTDAQSNSTSAAVPMPKLSPSFPFPVTIGKPLASFPQFSFLPTEIRLQIWEMAEFSPRFVEAQYCTAFYQPTFVKLPSRNTISLVCRESAEIASKIQLMPGEETAKLSMIPISGYRYSRLFANHPLLTPSQRQRALQQGEISEDWPLTTIRYVPSRDTIFLRCLDLFDAYPLQSFARSRSYFDMSGVQHLALPLDAASLPRSARWVATLHLMRNLKSLTLMVGSSEKSWGEGGVVELRPLHQWFADGRKRWIDPSGEKEVIVSLVELVNWLSHLDDNSLNEGTAVFPVHYSRDIIRISVRIVAWKRN